MHLRLREVVFCVTAVAHNQQLKKEKREKLSVLYNVFILNLISWTDILTRESHHNCHWRGGAWPIFITMVITSLQYEHLIDFGSTLFSWGSTISAFSPAEVVMISVC